MVSSPDRLLRSTGSRLAVLGVLIASILVVGVADRAVARTNACNGLSILVVYADSAAPERLRTELLADSGVTTVDHFNATLGSGGTPTVSQMSAYDMVVPLSDSPWVDSAALGNNLADYIDQRGTVVPLNFSFHDSAAAGIQGRYKIDGYSPFVYNTALDFSDATLGAHNANHSLMRGVAALSAFYRHDVTLAPGANQVAAWSDGSPLIAYLGRVVAINFHPQEGEPAAWSGNFATAIANAGQWLSVACPTTTTLRVGKTAEKIKASGRVSPNHSGRRVIVTLFRKAGGGSYHKVATKSPRLNGDSKYATSFNRPDSGSCRITTRFKAHTTHDPKHRQSSATKTFAC